MDGLRKALKHLLRIVLPWSALRLIYRRHAYRYIRRLRVTLDPSRKTVLVLNHFYDQDVRALILANDRYNLVPIDTVTLFRGAKIYFNPDIRGLHAPYGTADPDLVAKYREECRRIIEQLDRKLNLGVIVSASDIFYWIRELIVVARERGIRTVILDKEGTLSPHDFYAEADRIRTNAPFMSDHIFVWSERQKEFWKRIGVDDGAITVVGQARSDLLHRERRNDVEALFPVVKPLITLFSYMDDAYIPVELVRAEGLTWRQMKTETHDEISRLAQAHPEYNFVVKTHPQQPDLETLRRKYDRTNLRVVGGATLANELMQRSELIVAFQTTAVIEAMFLNKRVIYTYWDPLVGRLEKDLLPFHNAPGIAVARSFERFQNYCSRFIAGDLSPFEFDAATLKRRDEFINVYLYRPDGQVCRRFLESLEAFVK
jgi:hypothetical protein